MSETAAAASASAKASNIPEYTVAEISGAVKRVIEGEFGRVRVRGELGRVKLVLDDERAFLDAPESLPDAEAGKEFLLGAGEAEGAGGGAELV